MKQIISTKIVRQFFHLFKVIREKKQLKKLCIVFLTYIVLFFSFSSSSSPSSSSTYLLHFFILILKIEISITLLEVIYFCLKLTF
jgi:hypothetical protein